MNPSSRLHLPDLLRLLLRELRRRGVLRAASVYVVGAWVAIQAGDMKVGDRVRVSVQLFEAPAGTVLTSVVLDRHRGAPLELVESVVLEVGDSLLAQLGRERRARRWLAGTANPDAWALLQRAQRSAERARALMVRLDGSGALTELDAADSLLARAERLDPGYVDATVQRAQLAQYRAMVLLHSQPQAVAPVLQAGEAHATRALGKQQDAGAYEQRGSLRNLRAVFAPPQDTAAQAALWAEVEADARAALALDDRRIRARMLLADVLEGRGAFDQAALLLEEAYALDAYQENAVHTVDRLFTLNFEQARDSAAAYWCRELRRRKGLVVQTASCALQLAAWAEARPDVRHARALADSACAADSAGASRYGSELLDVLVAAVMARAGQRDSARSLLERVRFAHARYPELLQLQAGVHALLREYDAAGALLREYRQLEAGGGALLAQSRRFSSLPANPLAPARPM